MNKKRILIVGLGLIGGSYALGLTKAGYEVYGIDKNEDTISYAIENGFILDGTIRNNKDFINSFEYIILALYPKTLLEWIKENSSFIKDGTIISDVTGIKSRIVYEAQKALGKNIEFIAAHPMAGKEKIGLKYADNNIFNGANFIITPTENNTEKGLSFAKEIGKDLKFKNITVLTPEKHDEMIAFLSQLPHCLAIALMTAKDDETLNKLTGDSFKDLTRIAKINDEMWTELFLMNKETLLKEMYLFQNEFGKLKNAIENDDVEKIKSLMRLSTKRRTHFDEMED